MMAGSKVRERPKRAGHNQRGEELNNERTAGGIRAIGRKHNTQYQIQSTASSETMIVKETSRPKPGGDIIPSGGGGKLKQSGDLEAKRLKAVPHQGVRGALG